MNHTETLIKQASLEIHLIIETPKLLSECNTMDLLSSLSLSTF